MIFKKVCSEYWYVIEFFFNEILNNLMKDIFGFNFLPIYVCVSNI